MKPFFTYYGGKWRLASSYAMPVHKLVIEPFAGSLGYSVFWNVDKLLILDADPVILSIWRFLIGASVDDIMSLPDIKDDETTDDLLVPDGAKYLIGFWLNKGTSVPCKRPSTWAKSGLRPNSFWGSSIKARIVEQLPRIRNWEVVGNSYDQAPDEAATWFVDPPYQIAGRHYKFSFDNYDRLSEWVRSRRGMVIVCENEGAKWLPFVKHRRAIGTRGKDRTAVSNEVVYMEYHP